MLHRIFPLVDFAGVTITGAGCSTGEDTGRRGPVPSISPTMLSVHVAQGEPGGHSVRPPVLLGVHRGLVPDEPGVSPVPTACHAAIDRVFVPVRMILADGEALRQGRRRG